MLERTAHAKVNLALHVTGQKDNGYHLLDTLVVFTEFGDVISVKDAPASSSLISMAVDGPFAKGLDQDDNNLVTRAAWAMANKISGTNENLPPVEIRLTKNLPIASGIGGGSADAAATLLVLKDFWNSDLELFELASSLGADVPMCLNSKPLRAQGIGDEIQLLDSNTPLHIVLVNPCIEISTPEVFKGLQQAENSPISSTPLTVLPESNELNTMRNDLQAPALSMETVIQDTLNVLHDTDAQVVRMSGSGATCFGIYANLQQAKAAAEKIQSQHPDWWCIATSSTVS